MLSKYFRSSSVGLGEEFECLAELPETLKHLPLVLHIGEHNVVLLILKSKSTGNNIVIDLECSMWLAFVSVQSRYEAQNIQRQRVIIPKFRFRYWEDVIKYTFRFAISPHPN